MDQGKKPRVSVTRDSELPIRIPAGVDSPKNATSLLFGNLPPLSPMTIEIKPEAEPSESQGGLQDEGSSPDEEAPPKRVDWALDDLDPYLRVVWKNHSIKPKRSKWIKTRAIEVVRDFEEMRNTQYPEKEFREMVIEVATNIAEQCEAASKSKPRSADSTPVGNINPKIQSTPMGSLRIVNSSSNDRERLKTENKEVRFTPRHQSEIPADLTTKPRPDQVNTTWEERTRLYQQRESEMDLYGSTQIPDKVSCTSKDQPTTCGSTRSSSRKPSKRSRLIWAYGQTPH